MGDSESETWRLTDQQLRAFEVIEQGEISYLLVQILRYPVMRQ